MRLREVYEAYHSFQRVISGDVKGDFESMTPDQSLEWIASMRNKVDMDELYYTGHSFGGATVVRRDRYHTFIRIS
jgi:platelet-activating factor acetylhydrolase